MLIVQYSGVGHYYYKHTFCACIPYGYYPLGVVLTCITRACNMGLLPYEANPRLCDTVRSILRNNALLGNNTAKL